MTICDMVATQRADHSQLIRALPDMRAKGHVTMQGDVSDGRQSLVTLSDTRRAAYTCAAPATAQRRAALREVFSEDEIHVSAGLRDRLENALRLPAQALVTKQAADEDTR